MKQIKYNIILVLAVVLALVSATLWSCKTSGASKSIKDASVYASPSDIAVSGDTIYIADSGQNLIFKLTLDDGTLTVASKVALDLSPSAVALNDDGTVLYAAAGGAYGKVYRIDTSKMKMTGEADAGHTPTDIAFHNGTVYVAERFDNTVRSLDAETMKTKATEKTVREPSALAVADGCVWVAGHLPDGAANSGTTSSSVAAYAQETLEETARIDLTNGSTGVRGIAASPDGSVIYVTHVLGRYNVATTQLDRGWVYTNAVSVIDTASRTLRASVLLDDIDRGAANPWGAAATDSTLAVAIAGTGEIITLDTGKLLSKISLAGDGLLSDDDTPDTAAVADTLDFAYSFKLRTGTGDSGTRAVAAGDGFYITANYFNGDVMVLDARTLEITASASLATGAEESDERAGERLWNDASICYQEWLTCASCHPDARTDALNWDNLNDGIGTPKQARSMLYTFDRGHVMATGIRQSAGIAVEAGVKYILFNAGMSDEEKKQLDAYVRSLEPAESPYLEDDGTLSESAQRGKELFYGEAGCVECHANELYGNDKLIENHTQTGNESRGLLVPPLVEVWRTAPYLYDGRAATVYELLTKYNPLNEDGSTRHGKVGGMTEQQLRDIEQFVLSISSKREN